MKLWVTIVLILVAVCAVGYTQLTIFVVPPIGAVPEGRTVIINRTGQLKFVDSADAICERLTGSVNLLCRAMAMGKALEANTIYARLPYSETLYLISTDGKTYSR